MQLNEDARMVYGLVDEFGQRELLNVGYKELEPKGEFPYELVKKISEIDLMGISFPEEYGGLGMDTVATSVVGERLAFYWPSLQLIWSANVSLAGFPIMAFGTEEQKQRFLPRLASGEILGCYALTEPDAGSDAANIQAKATFDMNFDFDEHERGNHSGTWIINGTKTFITNAGKASVGVVFARVKEEGVQTQTKRYQGITAFIVDSEEPGLNVPGITINKIDKWMLRSSHFYEIIFDDANIPVENILGQEGDGFRIAMETLNNGRINIAAQAVGIARRALFEAESYGSERIVFGKPVIKFPEHRDKLRRLTKKVDRAWELVLHAADTKDLGCEYRVEAATAKLFASETAVKCAEFNLRIQGGFGCTTESIAMPIFHDAFVTTVYEGTSDILKMVITKG